MNRLAFLVFFLAQLWVTEGASSNRRKNCKNKKPAHAQMIYSDYPIVTSSRTSLPGKMICYASREEHPPVPVMSIGEALNYTGDSRILVEAYSRFFMSKLLEFSSPMVITFVLELVFPSAPEELEGRTCRTSFRTRMLSYSVCGMIFVLKRLWKAVGEYRCYGCEEWPTVIALLFKAVYYLDIWPFYLLMVMFPGILDWFLVYLLMTGAFMFYTIWLEVKSTKP